MTPLTSSPRAMDFRASADSATGRREANDDSYLIDPESGLFIVADGAGGRGGGQTASTMTCEEVAARLRGREPSEAAIVDAIAEAHEKVRARQVEPELVGMATTVSLVAWTSAGVRIAHVGDTRIYRYRDRALECLTRDHSLSNYEADHPNLARKHTAPGNTLVSAVGLNRAPPVPDQRLLEVREDDVFVMASDGLYLAVPEWVMCTILEGTFDVGEEATAKALVRSSLSCGSMDNSTCIVVRAGGAERGAVCLGWLVFDDGPRRGEVIQLGERTVFGARSTDDVVLDEAGGARQAEIVAEPMGFVLRDLGAAGGVFANDKRVKAVTLVDHDRVRIGRSGFIFKSYRHA